MSSTSTNKQPLLVDRPATSSTLLTVASGQLFSTSLIPTAVGNATKVFDVDSGLTDTSISGAYIDEIWLRYTKDTNIYTDAAQTTPTGTYARSGTSQVVTATNHNLKVGQYVYLDYTSGGLTDETIQVSAVTSTTFTGTSSSSGSASGNVTIYQPIDICFYLVDTGTVTNTNQFFPFFIANIESLSGSQTCSLTLKEVLPFINSPVVQAGTNFSSANNEIAPKQRGIILKRGQALYAAVSGTTALANGYYVNIQAGYY